MQITESLISPLAVLATATADYESAWRKSCALGSRTQWDAEQQRHVSTPESAATEEAMRAAYRRQAEAQQILSDALGPVSAHAITGALIQATARVQGARSDRPPLGPADTFIRACIREEAGI
jgi:hypothetical protein